MKEKKRKKRVVVINLIFILIFLIFISGRCSGSEEGRGGKGVVDGVVVEKKGDKSNKESKKEGIKEGVKEGVSDSKGDSKGSGKVREKKKVCVEKRGEGEKKEKEKEKEEGWKKELFPLSEDDLRYIRERAEKQKYIIEHERERKGQVRYYYVDDRSVYRVNMMVERASVICFWRELDESGYVVGSGEFKTELVENKKCIALYPLKSFKESNLVVFVEDFPFSFTIREVYERDELDYVVMVRRKPNLEAKEFLVYVTTGNFPEEIARWVDVREVEKNRREYVFNGFNRLKALEFRRGEIREFDLVSGYLIKGCSGDRCYLITRE